METSIFRNASSFGTYEEVLADIKAAEKQGFGRYWIPSAPTSADGLVVAAAAARETDSIDLAVGVVPVPPRHPMVLAQEALTVAGLAAGRLTLGLGMSVPPMIERVWGLPADKPRTRLIEFLEVLLPLLRGEGVDVQNGSQQVKGQLRLESVAAPSLYLAAMGPRMAETAGMLADGLFTFLAGPGALRDVLVPAAARGAEQANRPTPKVTCAVPVCITSDKGPALTAADELLSLYRGHPSGPRLLSADGYEGPGEFAIVGSLEEVNQRVGGLADAGADEVALMCFGPSPEQAQLTRDVIGEGHLGG